MYDWPIIVLSYTVLCPRPVYYQGHSGLMQMDFIAYETVNECFLSLTSIDSRTLPSKSVASSYVKLFRL